MNAIAIRVTAKGMLEFDMRHQPKQVSSTMALFGHIILHPEKFTRSPSQELGTVTVRVSQDGDEITGEARANNLSDHELTGLGWWAMQEYHHLLLKSIAQQNLAAQQAHQQHQAIIHDLRLGRGFRKANGG